MKKRGSLFLFAAIMTAIASINVGFGFWQTSKNSYSANNVQVTPSFNKASLVAKVVVGETTTYYYDLGRALKEAAGSSASETIFVIPSSDGMNEVSLTTDNGTYSSEDKRYHYTVASNDTLLLPYDTEGSYDSIDSFDRSTDSTANHDNGPSDTAPDTWCKLRVTMEENVAIDCYGDLKIGGEVGGDSPQGATHGRYAELVMGKNTRLTMGNGSTAKSLWCHGFIRDTEEYIDPEPSADNDYTKIIINNGVTVNQPMTVYGWGSAGNAKTKMDAGVFVFDRYELPNIRPKMRINYGGRLTGQAYMHGSLAGNMNTGGNIIGTSDALLLPQNGAYIIWNYDNKANLYQSGNESVVNHSCAISVYGDCRIGAFSIEITVMLRPIEVSTANFYFPLPYQYDVHVKNGGTVYVDYRLKLLPGMELYIDEGSSIVATANVIAYESRAYSSYPSNTPAKIINNGTVKVSSCNFTGDIYTDSTKKSRASIDFSNVLEVTDSYDHDGSTKYGPASFDRQCCYGNSTTLHDLGENELLISEPGNDYFQEGFRISLSTPEGTSEKSKEASYTVQATPENGESPYTYEWSISPAIDLTENGDTVTFTTPANTQEDNITYVLTCEATSSNGETYTTTGSYVARGAGKPLVLSTDPSDTSFATDKNSAGEWEITATATGGSGSYIFTWEFTTQVSSNPATIAVVSDTASTSTRKISIPKTNDDFSIFGRVISYNSQDFAVKLTLRDAIDGGDPVTKTFNFTATGGLAI